MAVDRIALLTPRIGDRRIVERSWGLRWSRSGVALWRRYEAIGSAPAAAGPTIVVRQGGRRGWIAAGVVALGSAGLTAAGVMAGPVLPRAERRALVSVAVPPAKPFGGKREAAPPEVKHAVVSAAAVLAAVPKRTDTPSEPAQASNVEIGEEGPAETSFNRRTDALAAALSTGRLQSWTEPEAGVRGFVVVGEAQAEADRTCRDVSVLIKGGDGNEVERFRRCIGAPAAG